MKKLERILKRKEGELQTVNRVLFGLRVKKLRYGLVERERITFVKLKGLQRKLKKQVNGLRGKVGQ